MSAISCPSATTCEAVGVNGSAGIAVSLTDGVLGTPQKIPESYVAAGSYYVNPGSVLSVICLSVSQCETVGNAVVNNTESDAVWPIINGVPGASAQLSSSVTAFSGVACPSPVTCIAVGAGVVDQFNPTVTPTPPITSPTATSHGYWLVGSDGGIFSFGSAQFYGSTGSLKLQRPVVGITPAANDAGYWLVASDGGIFSFGNAQYYGSIPGLGLAPAGSSSPKRLNAPIVGMVPTADGGGYFMVASDGGVFTFGDGKFEGSCPGIGGCSGAAVAVMPDATGNGYWLITATGHVYTFGDAPYLGSPGPQVSAVTSAVRTPDGEGYWILLANGTVYGYGDAVAHGGPVGSVGPANPATAIFTTADGGGYWVASANGSVFTYGDAPYEGGVSGVRLNGSIIAATGW